MRAALADKNLMKNRNPTPPSPYTIFPSTWFLSLILISKDGITELFRPSLAKPES